MKKSILIALTTIILILAVISFVLLNNQEPVKDIAGNEFSSFYTPEKEQMCCENCLNYGDYEDSKDCFEIIKENGGIRNCYLIMGSYPHTFSQCEQLI